MIPIWNKTVLLVLVSWRLLWMKDISAVTPHTLVWWATGRMYLKHYSCRHFTHFTTQHFFWKIFRSLFTGIITVLSCFIVLYCKAISFCAENPADLTKKVTVAHIRYDNYNVRLMLKCSEYHLWNSSFLR